VKGSSFSRNIPSSSSSSISTSAVSVQCEPADDMIEVMQKMFEVICENGDQSMFTRIEADGFCHVVRGINMKFSPKSNLILLHKSHMKTMRVTENLKFNGIVSREWSAIRSRGGEIFTSCVRAHFLQVLMGQTNSVKPFNHSKHVTVNKLSRTFLTRFLLLHFTGQKL